MLHLHHVDMKLTTSPVRIPALRATETYRVVHAWMERTLADETLQPQPQTKVVGQGLEAVQVGIDMLRKGLSAVKLVVRI